MHNLPRPTLFSLAALALACCLAPAAHAATTLTSFAPAQWGATDATLGLAPDARIEDFEDTTLITGLQVQASASSSGSYGPTGSLPMVFDPFADPYGNAFSTYPCGTAACSSLWDGTHALINTGNNQSAWYGSTSAWGDLTFSFAGGAKQVGFSLHQNEHAVDVYLNGAYFTALAGGGGGRTGYFRIDVSGAAAPITSLKLDGSIYDAWVVDHLAVTPAVPEPGSWALMAAGLAAVAGLARRRPVQA